jgi:hypothetical protein
VLDPYDDVVVNIGQIHSLSIIHGVILSLEDGNVIIIKLMSNISILHEDKLDGRYCCQHWKNSFTFYNPWSDIES